jgi:medium-chain acyl-[acyl-carrier-protein] hydrolase
MKMIRYNPWLISYGNHTAADCRLFCFHFAGGEASAFRDWANDLPENVEVVAIQLPGRAERHREQPFTDMRKLVVELYDAIHPFLDKPYFFFGHSLGATVAYELTARIQALGRAMPLHVMLSASQAPTADRRILRTSTLSDDEFSDHLRMYCGTPEVVIRDRSFFNAYLPRLRADFALIESYACPSRSSLQCPVSAYGGSDDPWIPESSVAGWGFCADTFDYRLFPGGHFYIRESRTELLQSLRKSIASHLRRASMRSIRPRPTSMSLAAALLAFHEDDCEQVLCGD